MVKWLLFGSATLGLVRTRQETLKVSALAPLLVPVGAGGFDLVTVLGILQAEHDSTSNGPGLRTDCAV